jgi:hypothetical protein
MFCVYISLHLFLSGNLHLVTRTLTKWIGLLSPRRWPLYLSLAAWSTLLLECSDVPCIMMRFTHTVAWLYIGMRLERWLWDQTYDRWPYVGPLCRFRQAMSVLHWHLPPWRTDIGMSAPYVGIPNPVNMTFTCKQSCPTYWVGSIELVWPFRSYP